MATNPQEYCPADNFYCPYCGAQLADCEVRDLEHAPGGERQETACATCGVVTVLNPHSVLSCAERERLARKRVGNLWKRFM